MLSEESMSNVTPGLIKLTKKWLQEPETQQTIADAIDRAEAISFKETESPLDPTILHLPFRANEPLQDTRLTAEATLASAFFWSKFN